MKRIAQKLEAEMAKAVSLIITASQEVAIEALNEAFGLAHQRRQPKIARGPHRGVPVSPHRTAAERKALEEGLLQAVRNAPGQSMTVLAPRIGEKSSQLRVAAARLKKSGRIKTVGERQFTRYFPIEGENNAEVVTDR